jgi:hypothetical protein
MRKQGDLHDRHGRKIRKYRMDVVMHDGKVFNYKRNNITELVILATRCLKSGWWTRARISSNLPRTLEELKEYDKNK